MTFETETWAGGAMRVTSAGFRTAATVRVFLAGRPLPLRPIDDSTLAADVPDTNGVFTLRVELDGVAVGTGDVRLHGYESSHPLPHFDGSLLPWPPGEGTLLGSMGYSAGASRLYLVDPAAGTTTRFLDDSLFDGACGSPGSGIGPDGRRVLVLPSAGAGPGQNCPVRAVDPTPPGTVVDTAPGFILGFTPWVSGVRLPGGHWVMSSKHFLRLARRETWGWSDSLYYNYSGALRFAVSPTGEFVVPVGGYAAGPSLVPILRSADLLAPTLLPGLVTDWTAVFTPSGDTVYIQGGDPYSPTWPDTLFAVDARTGVRLGGVAAPRLFDDLATDVARPWLYALTADSSAGGATLTIYDRRTMQVVAVQHAAGTAPWNAHDGDAFLALDASARRLHAVLTSNLLGGSAPSVAFTFSLMP